MLVYKARSRGTGIYKFGTEYILTTEKPDDVDEPVGEIRYVVTKKGTKEKLVFLSFDKLKEYRNATSKSR